MNEALVKYENETNIYCVTGYSFIRGRNIKPGFPEYSLNPLSSAWGWATWADRWEKFVKEITLKDIDILADFTQYLNFNFGCAYSEMLLNQIIDHNLTWDVLWYWTIFINHGFTVAPTRTMVNNIGMDGSGVHYTRKRNNKEELLDDKIKVINLDDVTVDDNVNNTIKHELRLLRKNYIFCDLFEYISWLLFRKKLLFFLAKKDN